MFTVVDDTDPWDDASIPNTITTKVDVEAEPSDCHLSLPDDSGPALEAAADHKTSTDAGRSDGTPEHAHMRVRRPKRRRREVGRARSAVESSSRPSQHSIDCSIRPRPSLPARPKLDSVINKDTGVSIIRPWSDQTICRTKQMMENEITVIDLEVMNNVAKAYQARSPAKQESTGNGNKDNKQCSSAKSSSIAKLNPNYVAAFETPQRSGSKSRHKSTNKKSPIKSSSNNDEDRSDVHALKSNSDTNVKHSDSSGNDQASSKDVLSKSDTDDSLHELRSKLDFKRNAVSEERAVEKVPPGKTSSHPSMKFRQGMYIDSSSDSDSDISYGEVFVPERNNFTTSSVKSSSVNKNCLKVKTRTKPSKSKPRPNSAEISKSSSFHSANNVIPKTKMKIHSSPSLHTSGSTTNGAVEKPKDIGFSRVSKMLARAANEVTGGESGSQRTPSIANSQESSVIGIDWLFDTDTDSSASGRV